MKALLRGSSPYDGVGANESLASYQPELVSLPADISGCPFLEDVLADNDRLYLKERSEQMLRGNDDVEHTELKPYWDPVLKHNKKEYNRLVRRLADIGYFNFTTRPECFVGIFFVWKSSRTRLRMITDGRLSNAKFRDAPPVSLMTSEGLGRIEIELDQELLGSGDFLENFSVHVGLSDVENCFHRLRVPMWMSRYFCWDAVPAKVVGLDGKQVDGVTLKPLDPIYPCAGSLCQGFSWALFFAQRANEQMCASISSLQDASLSFDKGEPIVMRVGAEKQSKLHYYVYVDNLGVIDTCETLVTEALDDLVSAFDASGLVLHGSEVTSGVVQALGCELDGTLRRTTLSRERLWRVHQALTGLLGRRKCAGRALEKIMGHCTFCGLMNRMSLSCFHVVYKFIQRHYDHAAFIWNSVRKELAGFRGCLLLLVQEWDRQWNPLVSSSDASLTGFGVCHAWWKKQQVALAGRTLERSRFRRSDFHSARESALVAAGFSKTGHGWAPIDSESMQKLQQAGWSVDPGFPEVPAAGLRRELWTPKLWGRWFHKEGILILEARTLLKSLKRVAFTRMGHTLRQLFLCDNMSVVLAVERFRAKNFKLLVIIREIASICMARNIHLAVRWIPSELNASDEPSRLFETAGSDLLIDCLGDFWPESSPATNTRQQHQHETDPRASPALPGESNKREASGAEETAEGSCLGSRGAGSGSEPCCQEAENPGQSERDFAASIAGEENSCAGPSNDRGSAERVDQESLGPGSRKASGRRSGSQFRQQQHRVRAEGRRKRKENSWATKQAKRCVERNSRCSGTESQESDHLGACGCFRKGEAELCQEAGRFSGFSEKGKASSPPGRGYGFSFSHLLQPEIFGGGGCTCGGLYPCSYHGCQSFLWQAGTSSPATCLEEPQGLEEALPCQVTTGVSFGGMVCNQLEDGAERTFAEGHFQPDAGVHLPQTWCASPAQKAGACPPYQRDYAALVGGDQPDRNRRHFEDWDKGRFYSPRLKVDHIHGTDLGAVEEGETIGQGLELQLCRVPLCLQELLQRSEDRSGPLPGSTLGPQHRQSKQCEDAGGSEKERRLDGSPVSGEVREGRPPCSNVAEVRQCHPVDLQGSRSKHRGHHPRPALPQHSAAVRGMKGQYFADLFSGVGGVAKAARRLGFSAREWELLHGENSDLTRLVTRPCVIYKFEQDIKHGKVLAAMLAPPCSSFSPARDRTCVVRTKDAPYGLDNLSPKDAEKVRIGNLCFKAAFRIIRVLNKYNVPWILENPHSSKCWYLPEIQNLMNLPSVHVRVTDFCCHGTRWRKRTRFLIGNINEQDTMRLQQTCSGTRGFCGRTNQQHFQLTRSGPRGVPWTRIAQPYPKRLCHHLAHSLLDYKFVIPAS